MNAKYAGIFAGVAIGVMTVIGTVQNAAQAGTFQAATDLVAIFANDPPVVDGVVDAMWDDVPEIQVQTVGGANAGTHDVTLQAAYTAEHVYFLVRWTDPTHSLRRFPWVKQADGSWLQMTDGSDHDEVIFYEDKFAFIWNTKNAIAGFDQAGCMITCHVGEPNKPYGNKYNANAGEVGDIWHWKGVRSNPVGYMDDQYLDDMRWSEDTPSAGRHSDPKDSGGYVNNRTEDGAAPAFIGPDGANGPYWILDDEKSEFVDTFVEGDEVPGILVKRPVGDRGDIDAHGEYADGMWTLEIRRALVTASDKDVQFDDLGKPYYFGVAAFDNAQVRHAFQTGVSALRFGERPTAAVERTWGEIKKTVVQ